VSRYDNPHRRPPSWSVSPLLVSDSGDDTSPLHFPDLLDIVARRVNEPLPELEGPDATLASTSFLRLPHPRTGHFLYLSKKKGRFAEQNFFNAAAPSLFLPYRRVQPAKSNDSDHSGDSWGILEVQSVSPPNKRSWFFTEGEVVSGKLYEYLRREADANYIDGQTGSSL
jgi:hypothetical protein